MYFNLLNLPSIQACQTDILQWSPPTWPASRLMAFGLQLPCWKPRAWSQGELHPKPRVGSDSPGRLCGNPGTSRPHQAQSSSALGKLPEQFPSPHRESWLSYPAVPPHFKVFQSFPCPIIPSPSKVWVYMQKQNLFINHILVQKRMIAVML